MRGGCLRGMCPRTGSCPGFHCSLVSLLSVWHPPPGLLPCDSRLHSDTLAKPLPNAPPPSPAAETPIEEFTPTPAFPALQYLESVDVEGVAWRAGLRTGDFLIEVRLLLTCGC